ncbi:hypothetical protein CDG81_01270 [Actinopolyspora erythraea]|uniref:SHSP domain-containing protein n=1 Tax=Actinopolyspora erythraea TaxID=414996 RepID=A0A223RMQ8_9ACTN|nr:Hsp20/alpha crystallin family protein [Actinopolyspora erythraea]ASU77172.1 hypothetical protein CDG81_01270 [Actinopolyspora erythraea]
MWDRMERMFDPGWSTTGAGGMWQPLVDVTGTEDAYEFEVELPGVDRNDINVEVRDHELWITGEVRERERSGVSHRRTRHTGSFSYRSSLPSGVDSENVEAKLDNGVLTVRVRKSERQKPHRVEIQRAPLPAPPDSPSDSPRVLRGRRGVRRFTVPFPKPREPGAGEVAGNSTPLHAGGRLAEQLRVK